MYARPSTSQSRAPSPRAMKGGAPPTARNARTGLLTPPGITRAAASSNRLDSLMLELHGHEVAARRVPAECGDRFDSAADHRGDDVDRARIGRFAADDGLPAVGFGKVRAGVDVRMIDHGDGEAMALEVPDAQQVLGIDVVRGAGIAGVAHGIAAVQLVLSVATAEQPSLGAPAQHHPAGLEGILFDRLGADRVELGRGQDHAPPASAGMMATSSPSPRGVPSPPSSSIGSLFT